MSVKKKKAQGRNWVQFQLAGMVAVLSNMTRRKELTAEEQDFAARLELDVVAFLDRIRSGRH